LQQSYSNQERTSCLLNLKVPTQPTHRSRSQHWYWFHVWHL